MKWSYSKSKTFRRCQRQWFYANCVANGVAKDPVRRSVYLLGKLQTIAGWRGSIVDRVIETDVIPSLRRRRPDPDALVARARRLYDMQLATALEHPLRQPERTVKSWGDAYAAFHCIEYGEAPSKEQLDGTWNEIETALRNLCAMEGLLGRLSGASQLVAQRSLQFQRFDGVNVIAVPDLIAFYLRCHHNSVGGAFGWDDGFFGSKLRKIHDGARLHYRLRRRPRKDGRRAADPARASGRAARP
jgi:hypothetical protein